MKRILLTITLVLLGCVMISACGDGAGGKNTYVQITPQEAKEIMDTESGYVILDVRTSEEFFERHIPGAVLIPDYEIA